MHSQIKQNLLQDDTPNAKSKKDKKMSSHNSLTEYDHTVGYDFFSSTLELEEFEDGVFGEVEMGLPSWNNAMPMDPAVPVLRPRRIDQSHRPEYQKLIDGDSIYTCSNFVPEATPLSLRQHPSASGKRLRKHTQTEHGPWCMTLEEVLKRRDRDRKSLWIRQIKKKKTQRLATHSSQCQISQAVDVEAQGTRDETAAGRAHPINSISSNDHIESSGLQGRFEASPSASRGQRATTPDLPSPDLLRSIHHGAMDFYKSHHVLNLPTVQRGRKSENWQEPIAMLRAFDGTALMALGVILEEIAKDDVADKT
ncbi:hypothetical protein O181_015371 [Austropuccinia psidii MF-1]|uniref:Uncharacterized protein n=1 Tax=Austropuccinia psidii MF-1 TaxID=1389203 RepID=A0A9Q3C3M2_9BASI|nr:hypothetical protein [Austropuccinia psidii MF-1]